MNYIIAGAVIAYVIFLAVFVIMGKWAAIGFMVAVPLILLAVKCLPWRRTIFPAIGGFVRATAPGVWAWMKANPPLVVAGVAGTVLVFYVVFSNDVNIIAVAVMGTIITAALITHFSVWPAVGRGIKWVLSKIFDGLKWCATTAPLTTLGVVLALTAIGSAYVMQISVGEVQGIALTVAVAAIVGVVLVPAIPLIKWALK